MGWEKGRYYTRTRRVEGKVVREYFGCGPEAERAAREDSEARDRRRLQRLEMQIERETCAALDAPFEVIDTFVALVVEVALTTAGYKRHNRGEWRKPRPRYDRFKPPIPLSRPGPQQSSPAPSSRPTPVAGPRPHSPIGTGVMSATQTDETPASAGVTPADPTPRCQGKEARTADSIPHSLGVPPTAEGCAQRQAPPSDAPIEPPGPAAAGDFVGEAGPIPQARPAHVVHSQNAQSAQSTRAGQSQKCHIINSDECSGIAGPSHGLAEGFSARFNEWVRGVTLSLAKRQRQLEPGPVPGSSWVAGTARSANRKAGPGLVTGARLLVRRTASRGRWLRHTMQNPLGQEAQRGKSVCL
jgi:hypothetical protein